MDSTSNPCADTKNRPSEGVSTTIAVRGKEYGEFDKRIALHARNLKYIVSVVEVGLQQRNLQ
jgi:hypothetical protein